MPKHVMVCISGFSGVGKDECASVLLNKFGAVQTGLADPAKRHMADVYGFSYEQLFGPSKFRNAGDLRFPKNLARDVGLTPCPDGVIPPYEKLEGSEELRGKKLWSFAIQGRKSVSGPLAEILSKLVTFTDEHGVRYFVAEGDPRFWLSPRESLQLYCELMNNLYLDTWVEKGINIHRQLGEVHQEDENDVFMRYAYDRMKGVVLNDIRNGENWKKNVGYTVTCFADFRHWHEVRAAKRVTDMTSVLVRIRSQRVPAPPFQHRSETEQATIPDSEFDFVLQNDGSVEEAHVRMEKMMRSVLSGEWTRSAGTRFL
jgi:hypothetical protein